MADDYYMYFEILSNPKGEYFWRLKDNSDNIVGSGEPKENSLIVLNDASLIRAFVTKSTPIYDETGKAR